MDSDWCWYMLIAAQIRPNQVHSYSSFPPKLLRSFLSLATTLIHFLDAPKIGKSKVISRLHLPPFIYGRKGGQWDSLRSISLANSFHMHLWPSSGLETHSSFNDGTSFHLKNTLNMIRYSAVLTDKSMVMVLWHNYARCYGDIKGWYMNLVRAKPGTA